MSRRGRGERGLVIVIGAVLAVGFFLLLLWRAIFITILPGHVGVLYSLLTHGTVLDRIYPEGLAVKLPWNRMYVFDVRTQRISVDVLALSKEGMTTNIELSLLFRARPAQTPHLLTEVGPDYADKVLRPLITKVAREEFGGYNSMELYSVDRIELRNKILDTLRGMKQAMLVDFQDALIKKIVLPKPVTDAIAEKLAQEQIAASYVFRIEAQRREAQRLQIEATGLQQFYDIVGNSLTERLLTWRGIEATVKLAKSPNTKIVIVGSGKDQLPLILGSDIHQLPATDKGAGGGETGAGGAKADADAGSEQATALKKTELFEPKFPSIPYLDRIAPMPDLKPDALP